MKKTVIVALVCVNAALLAALVLGAGAPAAHGQVFRGGADYLMMTGHIGEDWDAVYIIDLAQRRMAAWEFNKTRKRLVAIGVRDLRNDFRRKEAE